MSVAHFLAQKSKQVKKHSYFLKNFVYIKKIRFDVVLRNQKTSLLVSRVLVNAQVCKGQGVGHRSAQKRVFKVLLQKGSLRRLIFEL